MALESVNCQKLKFVLLGDSNCGKDEVFSKYFGKGIYKDSIGADFCDRRLFVLGKDVIAQVWNLNCLDRFASIRSNYYQQVKGIIYAFDNFDKKSFEDDMVWFDEVWDNLGHAVPGVLWGIHPKIGSISDKSVSDFIKVLEDTSGGLDFQYFLISDFVNEFMHHKIDMSLLTLVDFVLSSQSVGMDYYL